MNYRISHENNFPIKLLSHQKTMLLIVVLFQINLIVLDKDSSYIILFFCSIAENILHKQFNIAQRRNKQTRLRKKKKKQTTFKMFRNPFQRFVLLRLPTETERCQNNFFFFFYLYLLYVINVSNPHKRNRVNRRKAKKK